jgi:hypothetical protein
VQYSRTTPGCLPEDYQQQYVSLIASAYAATGDLDRARLRLSLLDLENTAAALEQFSSETEEGETLFEKQAVQQLALALKPPEPTPTVQNVILESETITLATETTASPGAGGSIILKQVQRVCDPDIDSPMIQFDIRNSYGSPLPGVQIQIVWEAGYNRLYSGLKPYASPGYADFTMDESYSYSVRVEGMAGQVSDLQVEDCFTDLGQRYPSSWLLQFQQVSP